MSVEAQTFQNPPDFWHNGPVVYQIYPRSFNDHDAGGEGTLRGIAGRLDYLNGEEESLGVDVIWLTPFYKSPFVDGGYDVETYREVAPRFGTMEDFRYLVDEAHAHNIKVMVDFVPNHTSTKNEWFKESSTSVDNPKSDWFVWRDPKPDGSPPNNWLSEFRERRYDEVSGIWQKYPRSAWKYVPARNQYVLCTFTEGQADLNWHNPEVREAMKNEMRFLLDKGVDGFRVDMVTCIGKHPELPDEPLNPNYDPACGDPNEQLLRMYRNSHPSMYPYINEMVAVLKEYEGRFMVTEDYVARDDPVARYMDYYNNVDPAMCAPFSFENFDFMMPHTAQAYKTFYDRYLSALRPDCVPTSVLGNHDQSRIATRVGPEAARGAAVMQLALPGMPFIYNGEELGMEDVEIPPHKIDDPHDGRDPERTPMLWTDGKNAGFSDAEDTWLPISPDYATKNVQAQLRDPHSFLSLYRRMLRIRRDSPALRRGAYLPEDTGHQHIFGFMRQHDGENILILRNFSERAANVCLRSSLLVGSVVVSSNIETPLKEIDLTELTLKPHEAVWVKL
jgi:alpha-glucosidase